MKSMSQSKIEWTEQTLNPIIGCKKISPGCKNCYAETMANRLSKIKITKRYAHVITDGKWNGLTSYQFEGIFEMVQYRKKPTMYFMPSMGDFFYENVSFWWLDEIFEQVKKCPQHTFQILTKRPERMLQYFTRHIFPPVNVWLGVTAENQKYLEERWSYLSNIPAKVKFISYEPALGPIDIEKLETKPDWIICGGESGHNARPMHPDWVRSLRDQCESANVPFFFKQWGEWSPSPKYDAWNCKSFYFEDGKTMYKIGKKLSGSKLYGKEYKQFPITND